MALFNGLELGPHAKRLGDRLYEGSKSFPLSPSNRPHRAALINPRPGFESAVLGMLLGLAEYADAHEKAYGSPVGEDLVLGDDVEEIGHALLGLLNGNCGRLDCGTLDGAIRRLLTDVGLKPER